MSGGNAIDHTALIARLRDDAFATPVRFPIKRSAVLAAHAIEECDSMRKALIALCDGGPNGAYHGRYSYDMDAFIEKVRAIIEGGGKVHDE
jgi:hypothetical protein